MQNKPVPITNAIHPHMQAHLLPRDNPYVAVTAKDGSFQIANLPAGAPLEFQVWHERAPNGLVARDWKQGRYTVELVADETKDLGDIEVTAEMVR